MILTLFLTFLEVGAVSFGGGYGMISLLCEKVLEHGWLTEEEMMNFIAVAESTPGPIAVNMATFVGSTQAGVLGAFVATLGIVLPAFIIMLIIASLVKNFINYAGVKAFIGGVKPSVVALIIGTAITMGLSVFLGISTNTDTVTFNIQAVVIMLILLEVDLLIRNYLKQKPNAIVMIIISAILGILIYST